MALSYSVNYLAVVIAAVVAIVIGFVWYAPQVFGNRWLAYLGTTRAALGQPSPAGIATGVIASLLNAWVLAVLATTLKASTAQEGIILGVLVWLGFMATLTAAQIGFEKKPWGLWVLNNAHNVIVQAVMGIVVAVVR